MAGWRSGRACYLTLAIDLDGERDVLGMWFQANEGAKFWMLVLTNLTNGADLHRELIRHSLKYVQASNTSRSPKTCGRSTRQSTPTKHLLALEAFERKVVGQQTDLPGVKHRALQVVPLLRQ